jgi:hypothetical protein
MSGGHPGMRRRLVRAAFLAAALASGAFTAGAGAQTPVPPSLLTGTFQMSGTVTVAQNVRGEHVGQAVTRTWTFTPQCAAAPCPTVQLVRQRATGSDTLILHHIPSGGYKGAGTFLAPLRCSGHVYPGGELIPFKIMVRVTASTNGVASAITATYVNRTRVNRTPCLGVLGHDAARYTGQAVAG